jgi:hypothetical protein
MPDAPQLSARDAADAALATIRARWRLVSFLAIGLPLIAIALNASQRSWQAQVQVAFTPLASNDALVEVGIPAQPVPTGNELLEDTIVNDVSRQVDSLEGLDAVRTRLQVDQTAERDATLTASAPSRERAMQLVDAWARAIVNSRNAALARQFDAARAVLVEQRNRASGPERADDRTLITRRLLQLDAARAAVEPDTTVTRGSTATQSGTTRFNEILAFVLGLGLGVGLALLLGVVDRRARTAAVVAAAHGLPLLGELPGNGGEGAVEAAARVDSRLIVRLGTTPSPLLVTSGRPSAAPHVTSLALVAAHAEAGRRAALVVWDAPEFAERARGEIGSDNGKATIVDVEGRWDQVAPRLEALAAEYDAVVLDAPPLLTGRDSLLATQAVAAWLVCGELGEVRTDDGEALQRELDGASRRPLGVVVTGGRPG